jgi:hypothetical protein
VHINRSLSSGLGEGTPSPRQLVRHSTPEAALRPRPCLGPIGKRVLDLQDVTHLCHPQVDWQITSSGLEMILISNLDLVSRFLGNSTRISAEIMSTASCFILS